MRLNYEDPFTMEAQRAAVEFMSVEPAQYGCASTTIKTIPSVPVDDYLSKCWRTMEYDTPAYGDGSGLWMTLTPMEVQSAHVAIERGHLHNHVAVGGLGLGYVPLAIAEHPNVHTVDVYEMNEDCVALFQLLHKDKPGFGKISFIIGDVRKKLNGKRYDYCYMDIYQTLLPEEVLEDIPLFRDNNEIGEYRFWGQELAIKVAVEYGHNFYLEDLPVTDEELHFFWKFEQSEFANLRPPMEDVGLCEDLCEAMLS